MLVRALMIATALLAPVSAYAQQAPAPATQAPAPATQTPAPAAQAADPAQFAATASASNLFEIQSSTLAVERAENPDVKAFAEQMIADHTKAAQDITAAAGTDGVALSDSLDAAHQQIVDQLGQQNGADFDAAYVQAQIQAHDEAVALFEGYATNGPDGALKDFAAATLPTLKSHQEHVRQLSQ